MNSWKLNGQAGHIARQAICKGLGIEFTRIYKEVKEISNGGIITAVDGKKYKLELKEVKDE